MQGKLSPSAIAIIATVVLSILLIVALAFGTKGRLSALERELSDIAVEIGLDKEKFIEAYRADSTDDKVQDDINDAKSRLSTGEGLSTPTIYVNGERLNLNNVYTVASGDDSETLMTLGGDIADYFNEMASIEGAELPIKVEVFEDIQCPFCGNFYIAKELAKAEVDSDEVQFIHRNLPLEEIHPVARRYARAIYAAADQGKEDEMIRKLFEKEHGGRLDFSVLDK